MKSPIIIGTRDSKLALWQANTVKDQLHELGINAELKLIKSIGDKDQQSTLQNLGAVGVFTKAIDQALVNGEVDIAVHSLKDAPTVPEKGLMLAAVLERENPFDVLLLSQNALEKTDPAFKLGTGSIRRKAQWKNKFRSRNISGLRGNVDTRLRKLEETDLDGIILAMAGLKRLGIEVANGEILDWMTPAPAQGIVGIYCRTEDKEIQQVLNKINHTKSMQSAICERALLNELEGGCSAPIGAFAVVNEAKISLQACLLSEDGLHRIDGVKKGNLADAEKIGRALAQEMLSEGGQALIEEIRHAQ